MKKERGNEADVRTVCAVVGGTQRAEKSARNSAEGMRRRITFPIAIDSWLPTRYSPSFSSVLLRSSLCV